MKLSDRLRTPPPILTRKVGDETVVLDLAHGAYFGLDEVGTRMWQLLVEGNTLEQVCDVMMDEYEASREDLERDVLALAEKLVADGLLAPA